ncbi:MAG: MBL fold metallo-hydrolase [Christensenellales bacterium]|jgi:ribonuclease BN (tRNA processing enzyme)
MKYRIIASGSKGNAVIIEDAILIDCGVSYKSLKNHIKDLRIVLLTHIHGDHFKRSTVRRMANERPALRFGCCEWLVKPLVECGVSKGNVDVLTLNKTYKYSFCIVEAFQLYHDVPNCGYKVQINDKSMMYATDTCRIDFSAPNFDLYLIEANYEDCEIEQRIEKKIADDVDYIYELKARENHLSLKKATDYIMANAGPASEYKLMHVHENLEVYDVRKSV